MGRRSWLALLPASKGTSEGGDGPSWDTVCSRHARQVSEALAMAARTMDDGPFARLTQTPDSQLAVVREVDRGVVEAPTIPAWERYTGVVHAMADPGSLANDARRRFRRHIGYVSALAGLVFADEPLPEYRLPMAANLHGVGPLATWWRDPIQARLSEHLSPGARLWLLTGAEYERAVVVPVGVHRVDVQFVESRGGRHVSPPSAAVKQARGLLARHLAVASGAGRDPGALVWRSLSFEAGQRVFQLEHADDAHQVWRASPA